MRHGLVTWTDRGGSPGSARSHGADDQGPVLRLLAQPESQGRYDCAWVLATPSSLPATKELVRQLKRQLPQVELRVLPVDDPSDYEQLFHALGPLCRELRRSHRAPTWALDVLLSAGTPQAQTLWVIWVQAGLLPARMLQVIPPQFVPVPHPRALREVRLDIEGFPEVRALRSEVQRLRAVAQGTAATSRLLGESQAMQDLRARIERIGRSAVQVPVLILGESGTGKELVARAVHAACRERSGPFLAENCGAFSEGVLGSELFGHEAGAFTGASARHRGVFEHAHGGTLFLDEVAELPARVQATLLRVLQEGVIRRVGGDGEVRVDVRIIAATHRDLSALVARGDFRQDLYYRLCGATLHVPPLRERVSDLPLLVDAFLTELQTSTGGRKLTLHAEVLRALAGYGWPGNIRELRAEVQRWAVFCDGSVALRDLSAELRSGDLRRHDGDRGSHMSARSASTPAPDSGSPAVPPTSLRAAEQWVIGRALAEHDQNISATARALGIDRGTLKRKLASYGLRQPSEPAEKRKKRAQR
jgi:DNA-binding NtrC family response regulator